MQNNANKLTNQQLKFAETTDYPRIKHEVVQFFINRFQELGAHMQSTIQHPLISKSEYKITKGENLNLMPYTVLDFPRITGADFPILMRTIFWWGHHISFNLFIHKSKIDLAKIGIVQMPQETYLLTSKDIWSQLIHSNDFEKIEHTIDLSKAIEPEYIKLSHTIGVEAYEALIPKSVIYQKWLDILCSDR